MLYFLSTNVNTKKCHINFKKINIHLAAFFSFPINKKWLSNIDIFIKTFKLKITLINLYHLSHPHGNQPFYTVILIKKGLNTLLIYMRKILFHKSILNMLKLSFT